MLTDTILAIDLGKYKSVSCVYDQATGEIRFTTFDTSRLELRSIIDREHPRRYRGRYRPLSGSFREFRARWSN